MRACICLFVCMYVCGSVLNFYLRRLPTRCALVDTLSIEVYIVKSFPFLSPARVHQCKTQVARTDTGELPVEDHVGYPFHLARVPVATLLFIVFIVPSCRYIEYIQATFTCKQLGRHIDRSCEH